MDGRQSAGPRCCHGNSREHRVTRRPPVEMLAEEQQRLHALPEAPYTAALGETRIVSWNSTIKPEGIMFVRIPDVHLRVV